MYRVSIGQRILKAFSATPLEPGQGLKARVERSRTALVLRVAATEERASAALPPTGIPNDPAARLALAALLRAGMGPEPRALARVRRAALREDGEAWSDLAAKMEAKGLAAEDEAIEALVGALAKGEDRGGGQTLPDEGQDAAGGRQAPMGEVKLEVPESELPETLASVLRDLAMRCATQTGAETAKSALALTLFNHARGPEGSWVIVPFHFSLDSVDFAGSFRIQLPYVRGGRGRFEARFSASRGSKSEAWAFFIEYGGSRDSSLRIERPDRPGILESSAAFGELASSLLPLSCSVRLCSRGEGAEARSPGLDLDA
jgi:hypothetical protein